MLMLVAHVQLLYFLAIQLTVQPGNTTFLLNQMSNATFHCACDDSICTSPLLWSLENEGRYFITNNHNDRVILAERGITFSSTDTSAVISIPDTVENNNTLIWCVTFLFGGVEFSDPPVEVIIIGESIANNNCYCILHHAMQWHRQGAR